MHFLSIRAGTEPKPEKPFVGAKTGTRQKKISVYSVPFMHVAKSRFQHVLLQICSLKTSTCPPSLHFSLFWRGILHSYWWRLRDYLITDNKIKKKMYAYVLKKAFYTNKSSIKIYSFWTKSKIGTKPIFIYFPTVTAISRIVNRRSDRII